MEKNEPNHPWVKEICKQSDPYNLPVLVSDVFPDIKLPTLSKDTLSIKDNLGNKLTIIDLWASWCAPCRKKIEIFWLRFGMNLIIMDCK